MQRENHHKCYLKWQEIFQIKRLYQEISDEIRFMHTHLQVETDRKVQENDENLNKVLNIFTWLIGVPVIVLTILDVGTSAGWMNTTIVATTSLLVGGIIFWTIKRRTNR